MAARARPGRSGGFGMCPGDLDDMAWGSRGIASAVTGGVCDLSGDLATLGDGETLDRFLAEALPRPSP